MLTGHLYEINRLISNAELTKSPDDFVVARHAVNDLEGVIEKKVKDELAKAVAEMLTVDEKRLVEIFQSLTNQIGPMLGPEGWLEFQKIVKPLTNLGLIDTSEAEEFWESYDFSHIRSDLGQ
jgi:hypothetical protein